MTQTLQQQFSPNASPALSDLVSTIQKFTLQSTKLSISFPYSKRNKDVANSPFLANESGNPFPSPLRYRCRTWVKHRGVGRGKQSH